jgi:hypothetical protein
VTPTEHSGRVCNATWRGGGGEVQNKSLQNKYLMMQTKNVTFSIVKTFI